MTIPTPNQLLLGFTAGYDKASNRLFERHLHNPLFSHLYPADQYGEEKGIRTYIALLCGSP